MAPFATARILLLLTLAAGAATGARAQSQPPPPPPDTSPPPPEPPTDLERVKRRLEKPSTGLAESVGKQSERTDDTTFRVSVTQTSIDVSSLLGEPTNIVAPYVHSWYFSNWHHEYLRMVTPDYARRATLYPQGMLPVSIVPGVTDVLKSAWRSYAERRAKQEVQEALEQFFREHPEARQPVPSPPPPADKPAGR